MPATATGFAMGGELRVLVRCPSVGEHAACLAAAVAARDEVARIEALATDWSPEGEIARLNAAAGQGPSPVSPEVEALLRVSRRVAEATEGAFDPTIGALWGLWDFEAGQLPDPAVLAGRLGRVGWRGLTVGEGSAALAEPGMTVTLGGVAQGYAASAALEAIPPGWEAAIDVSGDVAVRGTWAIEIQDPRGAEGESVASVTVRDAALSTSGDYRRFFVRDGRRYHHVLDPRTGFPAEGAWSATVVHPDGAVADALATALLVSGRDAPAIGALQAWALIVDAEGVWERGERAAGVIALRSERASAR